MIQVRSAIATSFGQQSTRVGLNVITVSWDGNGDDGGDIVHLDARTLYKYGNNMGVNFILEGDASDGAVSVSGTPKHLPVYYNKEEVENWAWAAIEDLDVGTTFFYNDTPEMYGTLRLQFSGTGPVTLTINRA